MMLTSKTTPQISIANQSIYCMTKAVTPKPTAYRHAGAVHSDNARCPKHDRYACKIKPRNRDDAPVVRWQKCGFWRGLA